MKTPIGTRIQNLERLIVESLKETGLVDHPHIYHGDLKKIDGPISITYKVREVPKRHREDYDPFFDMLPIPDMLAESYPGVLEIESSRDEEKQIRILKFRLCHSQNKEALEFKYDVFLKIYERILLYLRQRKGKK